MPLIRRGLPPLLPLVAAAVIVLASTGSPVGGTPAAAGASTVNASTTTPPWSSLCIGNLNPTGFELEYYWYDSCGQCRTAGDAGIADGRWLEYRCVGAPVGLDYTYPLYVRR